ncbi:hypothetical protein PRUPE_2G053500 [Prunus persica]|uniref:Exonuclease domain-containing protein n=1 Tax=Prunus persica TaxID=3760 RepID=A0A251QBN7_PRUPE|nr:hypothetical protein PRUPE_2G053500 [Prunus persica]
MEDLANAFSVLELDAEDDDQAREASSVSKNKDDTTKSSGLNVEVDRILEIACIITDGKLTKSVEGPDLVIHQTKECLDRMGEWCQSHHEASGLTKKVLESTISEREAEKQVIEFVTRNVGTYTPQLAGNSVYVDFAFLKKYMPDLASLFSHVIVDVSSVKALCIRWYPRVPLGGTGLPNLTQFKLLVRLL